MNQSGGDDSSRIQPRLDLTVGAVITLAEPTSSAQSASPIASGRAHGDGDDDEERRSRPRGPRFRRRWSRIGRRRVRSARWAPARRPRTSARCARGPSRSEVRARNPNRSAARVTSSRRRGCPPGLDVSQTSSPSKPVSSATRPARSRIEISSPVPRLTGLGAVVAVGGEEQALDAVLDVEELARRRPVAPERDARVAARPGLRHLADERGDHVRGLEVEVVARAVEVHGEEVDRVEPVLLAVGAGAGEQRALGDAVRRVRLLGEAGPEVVLAERDRRVLRVGADRADEDELRRRPPRGSPRARSRP